MRTTTSIGPLLAREHAVIGLVLDGMDRAIAALEQGHPVDPGLLRDLRAFLRLFVQRCHGGTEEQVLFPTLRLFPEMAGLVAELEREHLRCTALLDAFAAAVDDYARHGLEDAGLVIATARAYSAFLRRHMSREAEDLLPSAQRLEPAIVPLDLATEGACVEDEVLGQGAHERLQRRSATLAERLAALGTLHDPVGPILPLTQAVGGRGGPGELAGHAAL